MIFGFKKTTNMLKSEFSQIKNLPITYIISSLFLASVIGIVLYYIIYPSEGYLHSDCTDSLYWANASIESGKLIADNFRYAAILPFSSNIWMVPIIKMYGFGIKAQIISMVIFAILYIMSLIFVCHELRFSLPMNFTATGCILMILSSSAKMREIMWEHVIYYSLSLLLFNLLLGFSMMLIRSWSDFINDGKNTKLIVFLVALSALAFFAGGSALNGFQVILMTVIPVFAGILAEMIMNDKNNIISRESSGKIITVLIIPAFTLIGLIILGIEKGDVTANYTDYYSRFAPISKWSEQLLKFPGHFLTLIGFTDNSALLAEKEGIRNFIVFAVFILLLLTPFLSLFFYKKMKHAESRIAIVASVTLVCAIFFLFVCGNISNANWRLVPVVGCSSLALFTVINELLEAHKAAKPENRKKSWRGSPSLTLRCASCLVLVVLTFSLINYKDIKEMPPDYGRDNRVHTLTEILMENGLEYGYATFWNSQAITLLSNSSVKCREIIVSQKDGAKTDYYQSSYDWYDPIEGVDEYFVLVSIGELETLSRNSIWDVWVRNQLVRTINADGYMIYVFSGYLNGIK